MTIAVAIYLFKNVEVLDFAGPFEVFTTASRVFLKQNPGTPAPFKVFTVAKTSAPVQARADLRSQFPRVRVREGVRWVDEGAVVTSAGIAAGIDMSLHLVARLVSNELAIATARQMDVPYRREA